MDSLRDRFSGHDEAENGGSDESSATAAPPPAPAGDERRMQVRAYNFWAGLLGSRTFPDIADLDPAAPDFGANSVLLDFREGLDDPAIAWLGARLAEECGGASATMARLSDVPSRSLLSRITDHYMQILANQAPIGFEAEFVNQQGATILYRGILLPFSSDDATIDYIYGAINWKEAAADRAGQAHAAPESDGAGAPHARKGEMLAAWADGPAEIALGRIDPDYRPIEIPMAEFGLYGDHFDDRALALPPEDMGLADWLAAAREQAEAALGSEDRSRQALYAAVGRAYDFALAAEQAPADFAELLEDAGIRAQDRAPLLPLVKLVFGADYDKTRLTEFATAIAHGRRIGLACGALAGHIAATPGGLKALVRAERDLRRAESGQTQPQGRRARMIEGLRGLAPRPLESARSDSEFTVLVARRDADGRLVLLGEIGDDDALLDRAARHLLKDAPQP